MLVKSAVFLLIIVVKAQDKNQKAIMMGRDGQSVSCGKKTLLPQIFIVGYLKFVESKRMPAALCSKGYGASKWQGNFADGCPCVALQHP
jgi:hypothetical protein